MKILSHNEYCAMCDHVLDDDLSCPECEICSSNATGKKKITSKGGSTDYYKLPPTATELKHLISYKNMSFARGNIFKACYRLGEKKGVDLEYDLQKIKFFIEDLIEMNKKNEKI
tara:strand:- start:10259 stop:10600 length:342 start_codon:yes stop_codon:yes gene_type:complete